MIDCPKVSDISILHVYGEVTLLELELIQKMITSFKKCRFRKFLLDLAQVDHIHFKAIQSLVAEAQSLRSINGDIKIVHPNKQTREILKFTGADQSLEDYSTISEAILSFLKNPGPEHAGAMNWAGEASGNPDPVVSMN